MQGLGTDVRLISHSRVLAAISGILSVLCVCVSCVYGSCLASALVETNMNKHMGTFSTDRSLSWVVSATMLV